MDDAAPPIHADPQAADVAGPDTAHQLYALKDKDTFVVSNAFGDISGGSDGLFHNDTRILSRLRLTMGPRAPTLLSTAIAQDNVLFTANLSNPNLPLPGGVTPPGIFHLERRRLLWDERLYERIRLVNYSRDETILCLRLEFDADFRDMFEVRGMTRKERGVVLPPEVGERAVTFCYRGLDRIDRGSIIAFSEPPGRLCERSAEFMYPLQSQGRVDLYLEVGGHAGPPPSRARFRAATASARWEMRAKRRRGARISSHGGLFNDWLLKSRSDLALLTTAMETGPYPYAGIPWFSTAFGRDALITAWQILWLDPSVARGVLTYLAAHQAEEVSAFRDAMPGKIMHETRRGEMPNLGEVPFGRYYGGVDSTPLFIALAGAYAERTADFELIDQLWPALTRAANWLARYGDADGDGLIDYARAAESGLSNQGWKDSGDSVFHADGAFPRGPIALVEVQGYAFAALQAMSGFAARRGDASAAVSYAERAERLRAQVEERFWMEREGFYGIAVDGAGELCRTLASNAGHLLFAGLPTPARARRVAEQLLAPRFASGWGVRTLARDQPRYNPMSYHNGSVWPHDTGVCAMGLARYGERDGVVKLTSALFEAAVHFDMRLPELFCGFPRAPGEPPVAYPVACLPQAWAAGSVFMMLQACLGLRIDAIERRLEIADPRLPDGVHRLTIERLAIGRSLVDLRLEADNGRARLDVSGADGLRVDLR